MKRAVAIFLILAGLIAFVKAADVPVMVSNANNDLSFTPKTVMANPGDNIVFTWAGTIPHSVLEADSLTACAKSAKPNAFASGGSFTAPKTFNVTAVAGKTWFYCGVPGHCTAGMAGTLIVGGAANGTTGNGTAAPGGSAMPSGTGSMTMSMPMPSGSGTGSPAPTGTSSATRNYAAGFVVSSMCMVAALML